MTKETHADPRPEPVASVSKVRYTSGMPRWVKIFGIVAIALVAVFLIVHLSGGMGGMAMHH